MDTKVSLTQPMMLTYKPLILHLSVISRKLIFTYEPVSDRKAKYANHGFSDTVPALFKAPPNTHCEYID